MLQDIVEARPLHDFQLHLRFEDGVEGVVNVAKLIRFQGVFAPLQDRAYFKQVCVSPDTGTICWPNGADLDPDVLYAHIAAKPINVHETKIATTP